MSLFPEASNMDFPALIFMMGVYGYILMIGSQTISSGSEMLLLLYGPGIVGGLLIPILGAIPDCAIILISGLGEGTKSEIQHQLSVGVGTLVGSTVMLLTIPWAVGIYFGSKEYNKKSDSFDKKKDFKFSLTNTGVTVIKEIPGTAMIMIASSLSYLIIQIPSFFYKNESDGGVSEEAPYALTGVIVTFIAFCAYCWFQYSSAQRTEITKIEHQKLLIENWKKSLNQKYSSENLQEAVFKKHDKDNSGFIEKEELVEALKELGFKTVERSNINEIMKEIDIGHAEDNFKGKSDGKICLREFKQAVGYWLKYSQLNKTEESNNLKKEYHSHSTDNDSKQNLIDKKKSSIFVIAADDDKNSKNSEEEGDDDEEIEEQFWQMTDTQLKIQACLLLLIGTLVCTIFSDPMVDVISNVGLKLNISPFYISFVVTPLASNASEVIASLIFAKKKTVESISLTISTLHGAATMNSTLSLCIFMSIVYFRSLSWSFSAEVITVILVIIIVAMNALKKNIYMWQAIIVGSLYPLSIIFVYIMENCFGLD